MKIKVQVYHKTMYEIGRIVGQIEEIHMKEWLSKMHCKCGISCKSMWIACIALIVAVWAIVG